MACKNCQITFERDHEIEKPCPECGQTNPITYRCHIAVTITDKTDTSYAEIYSPDVELLIPFTADKFRAAEEEGRSAVAELEAAMENKHVVCIIKYFNKLIEGEVTRKYQLTKIYLYEDVFHRNDIVLAQSIMEDAVPYITTRKEVIDLTKDDEIIDMTKDEDDIPVQSKVKASKCGESPVKKVKAKTSQNWFIYV